MKLNKRIAVPLHRQLRQVIEDRINRGDYCPGHRIPTEEELCRQFGVSRITVRQALAALADEGLVLRRQGSGTFVNHHPAAKEVPLRAVVPEEQWVPLLKKAFRLVPRQGRGGAIRPEIKVLERPQLHTKIVSAVGEGNAPDLALIDWVWLTEFADRHYLRALDELDFSWTSEFKADLFPLFVENNSFGGHLYGMQPGANVSLVWYRKDWFREEGLPPPQTWEEVVQTGERFATRVARRRYGLGSHPVAFPAGPNAGETTTYVLSSLIWSAGGELYDGKRVVLDEGARRAVGFLRDLVQHRRLAPPAVCWYGFNEVPRRFARGEAAIAFGGSYEKAVIHKVSGWDEEEFRQRVGFVAVPAGPGGRPATTAGGTVFVVFRQSARPELAMEALKTLASPGPMGEMCRATGRKPTRVSVVRALDKERDWFIYETSKLLELARVRPTVRCYAQISARLQRMVAQGVASAKALGDVLGEAQAFIDQLAEVSLPSPLHS